MWGFCWRFSASGFQKRHAKPQTKKVHVDSALLTKKEYKGKTPDLRP
jgi:hypothetical protein